MTVNETIDGLQEIIDGNQRTILPRVHIGYLIHAVKYLREQKEEIENLKQTAQSMMESICLLREQEVKTGYWIDSAGNDKCSICGEEYSDLYPDYGNTHFCPNCGAKMEGR